MPAARFSPPAKAKTRRSNGLAWPHGDRRRAAHATGRASVPRPPTGAGSRPAAGEPASRVCRRRHADRHLALARRHPRQQQGGHGDAHDEKHEGDDDAEDEGLTRRPGARVVEPLPAGRDEQPRLGGCRPSVSFGPAMVEPGRRSIREYCVGRIRGLPRAHIRP